MKRKKVYYKRFVSKQRISTDNKVFKRVKENEKKSEVQ